MAEAHDATQPYYDHAVRRSGKRPDVAAVVPPTAMRILEIGCAEGSFADNFDRPIEFWGIEPHAPSAELAKGRMHRVFASTFEQAFEHLPRGHFDAIVCNDVIEHMPDHDRFLHEVKPLFAPGGTLIASIPNVRYFWNLFDLLLKKQ
ncbi:MAG: hypothetical protein RL398_2900 [Planctomycetota bacterium]|jgi:2-polyprenyl-3-methyl-5-hydroxy-6-metoxy-1,4-benzoquinol methylase